MEGCSEGGRSFKKQNVNKEYLDGYIQPFGKPYRHNLFPSTVCAEKIRTNGSRINKTYNCHEVYNTSCQCSFSKENPNSTTSKVGSTTSPTIGQFETSEKVSEFRKGHLCVKNKEAKANFNCNWQTRMPNGSTHMDLLIMDLLISKYPTNCQNSIRQWKGPVPFMKQKYLPTDWT